MSWTLSSEGRSHVPFRDRIEHLPLLIAGPILRRTQNDAVTVWVALKAHRQVTLKVYATEDNGSTLKTLLFEGSRSTVPLGKHIHIVAVTAHAISSQQLESGQIYAYDLSFGTQEQTLIQALTTKLIPQATVSYFEHQLPTFALPPEDLNNLRLAHGSCRKLHGGGPDAVPMLDDLIGYSAQDPNARLHQLFFTGDQIYGDDVADPLLWVATEIGDILLAWEEKLPFSLTPKGYEYKKPSELKPGKRTDIAKDYAGFTAMLIDSPEEAKSHLFSLGEYFAIYLLVWSPILWPDDFPQGNQIHEDSKQARGWDEEVRHLKDCISQMGKVRRALANVPTYMIFDDHDISDDWYLNRAWCTSVLSKPLGRRAVQNGMLAYAVFQAWGNTPDQFQEGQPGDNLLQAAISWSASAGTDESASQDIAKYLGIPELEPETGLPKFKLDEDVLILDRDYSDQAIPIAWHYTVRSYKHEVIVLDTRTWRGYPPSAKGDIAPPRLLCPTAFKQQLQDPLEFSDRLKQTGNLDIEATFVILPTNLVSLQIIDVVQRLELEKGNVFNSDVGDAWNLNEVALSRLLTELFQRRQVVVVLSGDIHYGATIRLSYWFNPHAEEIENRGQAGQGSGSTEISEQASPLPQKTSPLSSQCPIPSNAGVLAQLTASAFKNGELKTYLIHTKAKSLAPEAPQDWAGWNNPPQLMEIQITPEKVRMLEVEVPTTGPVVRQIRGRCGNWEIAWEIAIKNYQSLPDWQYHIEWIKREKATVAPWIKQQVSSAPSNHNSTGWLTTVGNWLSMLWRNSWLQEGKEVIGRNNFGVVSLKWSPNNEVTKAVIQDLYWQPPWEPTCVVYSRYVVPLCVDMPPPSPRVIETL
ncbi:MAG: PhoD-like phosphatase [Cyanobacteriota bacterium]